jgi:hypothetical protein
MGRSEQGVLWISGDTVLYEGVRQVAHRFEVDTAILHLGAVRGMVPLLAGKGRGRTRPRGGSRQHPETFRLLPIGLGDQEIAR